LIAAACDTIDTELRELGYVKADSEETLRDRRYIIRMDELVSDNQQRGAASSGVVRVSRIVHVRVQYAESRRRARWYRDVAVDQETISVALYVATPSSVSWSLSMASIEEREDGAISDIAMYCLGQIE
jgi:hypothetical protein|tara:strand:+ start:205 stop:588 length:384 start_codon:yes stop_codon:yes gene_type:complete